MDDERSAEEPMGADARESALDARLRAACEREDRRTNPVRNEEAESSARLGNRVLAELLGGIGGGALIGWVIDHFAGTSPWGLLVVMMLGIVVAFRNIIRLSNRRPD